MNLIGQWNKDKTQCWQMGTNWLAGTDGSKQWMYRAECWSRHDPDCDTNDINPDGIEKPCNCTPSNAFTMNQAMPWRDSLEEAQKDIPQDEN